MPRYVTPDVVEQARKVDLLSYLQATAPNELVRCGAEEYCTREHDSLKISHGKWYWWSRGIGGASALDYLVKGLGMDFVSAVQAVMNQTPAVRITPPPKHEKPTHPALPRYTFDCKTVKEYLQERGVDGEIIDNFIKQQQIAESVKTGAALFFGKDKNGNVRQCSERATDGTPNKKDTYGSDRSYCFFSEARAPCTSVSVFESAIDLMSFATIMKRRGLDYRHFRVCTCPERTKRISGFPPRWNDFCVSIPTRKPSIFTLTVITPADEVQPVLLRFLETDMMSDTFRRSSERTTTIT